MIWSTILTHINTQTLLCCLLITKGTYEFDKIYSFLGPSIKCYSSFVCENYLRKIKFHLFLGPIMTLWNICWSKKRFPKRFVYRSQFTKYSTLFVLLDSVNPINLKDLSGGQKLCCSNLLYVHLEEASTWSLFILLWIPYSLLYHSMVSAELLWYFQNRHSFI